MLSNLGDLQDEFLVRGNIATSVGFVNDTILNDWTRIASLWAGATHKFPFTEGRISTTFSASYCSDMEVNPLISEKRIVNLSLVPTSAFNTSSGDLSINMESIEGDTYWESIFFIFLLSFPSVMLRNAKEPIHEMTIEIVGATMSNTILCLNHQKEADI